LFAILLKFMAYRAPGYFTVTSTAQPLPDEVLPAATFPYKSALVR
jgi:hypothetical protein